MYEEMQMQLDWFNDFVDYVQQNSYNTYNEAYAKDIYVYRESDDEDATMYLTKTGVMEIIEEHNEMFDTNYKTIADFNKGEQKANGIRSIETLGYCEYADLKEEINN